VAPSSYSLDGSGVIERPDGSVVSRGVYWLTITQEDPSAWPLIEGYIESLEIPADGVVDLNGNLVLKLQDGRQLPFFFHLVSERRRVGYVASRVGNWL
jgi:hypothetical protein